MGTTEVRKPKRAPFGSWRSPITTQMLVEGIVRISDISLDDAALYWVEARPEEDGRCVIARRNDDGTIENILPPPFSARTLVHEYGGGALLASAGDVYFSNFDDQRIWRITPHQAPKPVTLEGPLRFADFVHDQTRNRLISVCEDHSQEGQEPTNRIVSVATENGRITTLVEGADFYSTPRLSPDGQQLAWLSWNHPNMPWDGTEWTSRIDSRVRVSKTRFRARPAFLIPSSSFSPLATLNCVANRIVQQYSRSTAIIRFPAIHNNRRNHATATIPANDHNLRRAGTGQSRRVG